MWWTAPGFEWREWGKQREISVRAAVAQGGIWPTDLPNPTHSTAVFSYVLLNFFVYMLIYHLAGRSSITSRDITIILCIETGSRAQSPEGDADKPQSYSSVVENTWNFLHAPQHAKICRPSHTKEHIIVNLNHTRDNCIALTLST
jgi:hypothetical protein